MSDFNNDNDNDNDKTEQNLRQAAALVDQQLDAGQMVEVDPELAEFMGIIPDDDFPADDALEAHLFPYGRPDDEKGGEA
ncbi:hypothetical protein [Insolitispirillum peregrinum]|uniref:Uncharacterized protein n=1 Tax=Insolitispirillum peregrinum TaxID=80876 RepID=A0A1N7MGD6_9PROT|nr:hypothetical protein [Insolitispirillum peregrinum]SIS85214.1 hypothetical protein SAMN05421779_104109 [Insolitispirillum peregrinum]